MKKIVLTAMLVLSVVVGAQAQNWNIPNGSYTCKVVSINDKNWKPVVYFTKTQRDSDLVGFVLDDTKIVDASGQVFDNAGDNSEGTNNFVATDYENAIYISKNAKQNGAYNVGLGHMSNNKIVRMMMTCTKD